MNDLLASPGPSPLSAIPNLDRADDGRIVVLAKGLVGSVFSTLTISLRDTRSEKR